VGKFIPVEPEKWAEMVKAQAEVARLEALTSEMDKTINASQAECRRLKAEVERLTPLLGDIVPFDEYHKLLQQVERVGAENSHLHKGIYSLSLNVGQLKDEVERLTEAGYAMAVKINVHGINDRFTDSQKLVDDWSNAAKKGGQP